MDFEAIIIGGSFSGLSAATQLARARRKVLVVDAGEPRNRFASASHGFLGQDGETPGAILAKARQELDAYPTAAIMDDTVTRAKRSDGGFAVSLRSAVDATAKRLILATGVVDHLPPLPGLAERWGRSVFHCPYCHGYELQQGRIAVLAIGPVSLHHAMMLPDWGPTTLFTNGALDLDPEQRAALQRRGVTVEGEIVQAAEDGANGGIALHLGDGRKEEFSGLFVAPWMEMAAPFAADLGCDFEEGPLGRYVRTDAMKATSVEGVFACGDAARMAGSVPLAVADGALAGVSAHRSLIFGTH